MTESGSGSRHPTRSVLDTMAVKFAEGVEIFRTGEAAVRMYVVREGTVELTQRILGAEKRVGVAGPGDTIGEVALLPDRQHTVTARALEPVTAIALSVDTCVEMVKEQPEIGLRMLQKLTERLADAHGQVEGLLQREAVFRVTQALSNLADTQKAETNSDGFRLVRVRNEALASICRVMEPILLDVLAGLADSGLLRRKDFGTLLVAPRIELDTFLDRLVDVRRRIRVLVVDDSSLFRRVLSTALETLPDIKVIGTAANGQEGLVQVRALRPDVVVMDVQMPILNGIEATRAIMAEIPTPILIMTSLAEVDDGSLTFEALRAGAIALWPKPTEIAMRPKDAMKLGDELKKLAEIDVGRVTAPLVAAPGSLELTGANARRIGIVAEAGGPQGLTWILSHLPSSFSGQILITQHLEGPHHRTLADWLASHGNLPCSIARHGEPFVPGTVRLAPHDNDLLVMPDGTIAVVPHRYETAGRTPGNLLLESLALFEGTSSVGVILSGGGSDGAQGLRALRDAGGLALIEHPGDAVVDAMPRACLLSVPEARVFDLAELPSILVQLTTGRTKTTAPGALP